MKSRKEVGEIVGLSKRDIERYEEKGLAKSPKTKNKYGHLLYSEEEIAKLWILKFYKEAEYTIPEIFKIMNTDNYDEQEALGNLIIKLENKIKKLEHLVSVAKMMRELNNDIISTKVISSLNDNTSFDNTIALLGGAYNEIFQGDPKKIIKEVNLNDEEINAIAKTIGKIVRLKNIEESYDSTKVQEQVRKYFDIHTTHIPSSVFIFKGLITNLAPGGSIFKTLNDDFGEDVAMFIFKAIEYFCQNNIGNDDEIIFNSIAEVGTLGVKGYSENSKEVQEQLSKIYSIVEKVELFNDRGKIKLLALLGESFSNGKLINKEEIETNEELEVYSFISRSIEIYVKNLEKKEDI